MMLALSSLLAEAEGPILPSEVGHPSTSGSKKAEVICISVCDIQSGKIEKNITLRPNDTIFVPQAPRVFVSAEARNRTTVRQAISVAGGFTDRASTGHLRVVREIQGKTKELRIKLDDRVGPGDRILAKEKTF